MLDRRRWVWFASLLLAACSSAPAVIPARPAQKAIEPAAAVRLGREERELLVGISGDYAPFSMQHESGVPRGFDADVALLLARDLGLTVRWVQFRWPELTERLTSGKFDVAMSEGGSWRPGRGRASAIASS